MFTTTYSKCELGQRNNDDSYHYQRRTRKWLVAALLMLLPLAARVQYAVALSTMKLKYTWGVFDFDFDRQLKTKLERSGAYDPANFTPFDVDVDSWRNRVFMTFPSLYYGSGVTLATIKDLRKTDSPQLVPYPDISWHAGQRKCEGLTSVFRVYVDQCRRLWVIDSGVQDIASTYNRTCPPQLFVFNLINDKLLERHVLDVPESARENSLILNVIAEQRGYRCTNDAYAYIADAGASTLYVYSLRSQRSWRVQNSLFLPDAAASEFLINGTGFTLEDGILGLAQDTDYLYFHGFSSFSEARVPKFILRQESLFVNGNNATPGGFESLGRREFQSAGEVMNKDRVLFFHQMGSDSIYCWNAATEYDRVNQHEVEHDGTLLHFVTSLKAVERWRGVEIWAIDNNGQYIFAGEYRTRQPHTVNIVVGLSDDLSSKCRVVRGGDVTTSAATLRKTCQIELCKKIKTTDLCSVWQKYVCDACLRSRKICKKILE